MKMISVVFPVFNEQDNLQLLYNRIVNVVEKFKKYCFEFVFVNDCSSDKSAVIINELRRKDQRVHHIQFARNSGSHAAVAAGFQFCNGHAAIILAADLQDPPEIIPRLIEKWESGFDKVWGVRENRKGEKYATLLFSKWYYHLLNRYSNVQQPPSGSDVLLIDRKVIEAFKASREKNTSVIMLISWLGFSQTSIGYIKEERHAGVSKWTLSKKFKLFFDSLVSFSYAPLRIMSLMGTITAMLGLLYSAIVLINAIRGIPVQGWASLMIVVLLMGGFQMIMLGMLGEYLWRAYDETRGRPRYVIEANTLLDGQKAKLQ